MNDRQIDALIAEKVFGWKWYTAPNGFKVLFSPSDSMLVNTEDAPCYVEREGQYQHTHNYTTDPAASRQLREKLAERFTYVRVDICNGVITGSRAYIARAWHPAKESFSAEADTEHMAVAKAALLTVGVKV